MIIGIICGVATVIAIAAVIVNKIDSKELSTAKDFTVLASHYLYRLDNAPPEGLVDKYVFSNLTRNIQSLNLLYEDLTDKDQAKYDKWIANEFNTSISELIDRTADYGIGLDTDYTDDELMKSLSDAYINNGFKAPYSGGSVAGNVPDIGAKKYSEAEITLIALDNNLRADYDDYEGIYRYYSERTNKNHWNRPSIYLYIVNKGEDYALKCVIHYFAPSWVFWETVTAKINGQIVEVPVYGEPSRDTSIDANVKEVYETAVTSGDELYNILKQASEAPGIEVKFIGDEKSRVMKMTEEDCKAIKDVLDAFDIIRAGKSNK